MSQQEDLRWKAQDALRTIHQAEQHKQDKPLMKHVKKLAAEQAKAVGGSPRALAKATQAQRPVAVAKKLMGKNPMLAGKK